MLLGRIQKTLVFSSFAPVSRNDCVGTARAISEPSGCVRTGPQYRTPWGVNRMKAFTRLTTWGLWLVCVGLPLIPTIPATAAPCSGTCDPRAHRDATPGTKQEIRYVIHTPRGSTDCLDRVVVRGR